MVSLFHRATINKTQSCRCRRNAQKPARIRNGFVVDTATRLLITVSTAGEHAIRSLPSQ